MPTLTQIIQDDAASLLDVDVDIDRDFLTVAIEDQTGIYDDIFIQGEEAEEFIEELDRIYEEAGDVTEDEVAKHLARPYVECIWG